MVECIIKTWHSVENLKQCFTHAGRHHYPHVKIRFLFTLSRCCGFTEPERLLRKEISSTEQTGKHSLDVKASVGARLSWLLLVIVFNSKKR